MGAKSPRRRPHYLDYYLTYPDRTMPDRYEETLPEVFPDFAPGNFTYYDDWQRWVWTTFNEYQWDLNYQNPHVFAEMLEIILYLANQGVEILRLDAVAFMWKRLGTDSQNQPEAHYILQAWRALTRIAAPGLILKAEAIVPPTSWSNIWARAKRPTRSANWPTTTSSWCCCGAVWPSSRCGC
jgi:amylosucrase